MDTVVVKNLTKKFGTTTALDDLSLTIPMGKMTGIIGADASGKTTLLRIIIGLLKADAGTVVTLGLDPASQKRTLTAKIGYMPQKFGLYEDLTVRENLEFYADLKAVDKEFSTLLDFTGLQPFQDRLAGKLSGGMRRPHSPPGSDASGQNYDNARNHRSLVHCLFRRSKQLR